MDLYGMDLIGKAERIKHVAEDDEERNVVDISEVCEEEDGESSDTDTNDALHLRESGDISAKEGKIREVIQEKKAVNSTRKASKTLISEKDDSYRENFPSSCSRWKSLEIHCNNSQSLQQSSVSTSDSQRLPELSFNRLQPCDKECDGLHRQFGRFLAREAVLDEEYWTAAWLRAEAHWESISYMRLVSISIMNLVKPYFHGGHIEAFKRKYAQQEFYALKSLCSGQDGNSLKRFCLVTTAGAVGGVAASLIRVPTEVVKQRMQAGQFVSAPDAVRLIVAKEGFKGLYAGYRSFLLRDLPFDYEQLRIGYKLATAGAVGGDAASLIRVPTERMQAGQFVSAPDAARLTVAKEGFKGLYATAGAVGGVAASLIRVPTEVVKQRMQAGQFVSAPDAVHLTVAKEGFKGLYAGYRSFLLRDLPFDYEQLRIGYKLAGVGPRVLRIGIGGSIFFGVLESTKRFLAESRAKRIENPVKKRFLAGCSYRNKGAY